MLKGDAVEATLQSLYHVIKANPPVALQCLGRFQVLFQLLRSTTNIAYLALQVKQLLPL